MAPHRGPMPSGTRCSGHNPENRNGSNRDRFVLSAGHGCMLLYSLLHLTGYKAVRPRDLSQFPAVGGSKTPGHRKPSRPRALRSPPGPARQGMRHAGGPWRSPKATCRQVQPAGVVLVDHFTLRDHG